MHLIKAVGFVLILLTGACASTPEARGSREAEQKPLRGGIAEFKVLSYNGELVEGRVLLGATIDPLVIDGRLFDAFNVELQNLRACGRKELVEFQTIEPLFPPPRPDQIITIRPGYWYGGKVKLMLLNSSATGIGLECFEAELVVTDNAGRVAARLPIRVVRTDKPPAKPDGGTEEPKPSASDAGAP